MHRLIELESTFPPSVTSTAKKKIEPQKVFPQTLATDELGCVLQQQKIQKRLMQDISAQMEIQKYTTWAILTHCARLEEEVQDMKIRVEEAIREVASLKKDKGRFGYIINRHVKLEARIKEMKEELRGLRHQKSTEGR